MRLSIGSNFSQLLCVLLISSSFVGRSAGAFVVGPSSSSHGLFSRTATTTITTTSLQDSSSQSLSKSSFAKSLTSSLASPASSSHNLQARQPGQRRPGNKTELYVSTTKQATTDTDSADSLSSSSSSSSSSPVSSPVSAIAAAAAKTSEESLEVEQGSDGIYQIANKAQHKAFLAEHSDKLVILKIYAPWCRACKGLEPKYQQLSKTPIYGTLPLVFAQLSVANNKAFVQSLGVLALPTIQFYVAGQLTDNFPCGPSKVPILKRKLAALVNEHVDPKSRLLKETSRNVQAVAFAPSTVDLETSAALPAAASEAATANGTATETSIPSIPLNLKRAANMTITGAAAASVAKQPGSEHEILSEEDKRKLRKVVPYFEEMSLVDLDTVFSKAKLLTFEAGSIIMREGRDGRTFYVVQSGEVEICQNVVMFDDPLATPSNYLGTVINRLADPGDYFGERALITGEPRAASIRATERTTVWAFDRDDFPASSPLSGKTRNTFELDAVNDKYGVSFTELYDDIIAQQMTQDAGRASQVRGSVNTPQVIKGVDTDDEVEYWEEANGEKDIFKQQQLSNEARSMDFGISAGGGDAILALLTRFQMIRHVKRVFDYIVKTQVRWGDQGIRARRSMLINRLTPSQRRDCMDTFKLIDASGDGLISLLELKTVLESVGERKSDSEWEEIIAKGHDDSNLPLPPTTPLTRSFNSTVGINGNTAAERNNQIITKQDFMGIWAEAEFYYLFRDIFASLDHDDTGFVKAGELDHVLCGVRDLISDDRKSIIDVDDVDMLIDYEQFSRMLLGSTLI